MIHVVEDDAGVRELELYALRQAGFEAEGFAEPSAFRQALRKTIPQLVLLDVMLPEEDGVSLLRFIRREAHLHKVPVILVTARDAEVDKVRGLDEGADDYLTKPFGVMELLARVRALLRRSSDVAAEDIIRLDSIELDRARHRVFADGVPVILTNMEFQLLDYLLTHAGTVITREKLLDRVWGTVYAGDTRTVDVHIRSLRQKLGSSGSHIITVRGLGYKLEDDHA
ncbi:MAG: response regulator transcription factor [Clostridia bacterium]|nr:response regulator transcription factor [Clostridia bacterium]